MTPRTSPRSPRARRARSAFWPRAALRPSSRRGLRRFARLGAWLVGPALLLAAACNRDEEVVRDHDAAAPVEIAPSDEDAEAIAELEDALPEALKGELRFEMRELQDGDLVGAVPVGWERGSIPGSLRPPEDAELGFHTRYKLGFACAGDCAPKDWEEAIAQSELAEYTSGESFQVVRDDALDPQGRIVVAERKERLDLALTWWEQGAARYALCRVTLDGPAAAAAEAFEKACRLTRFRL